MILSLFALFLWIYLVVVNIGHLITIVGAVFGQRVSRFVLPKSVTSRTCPPPPSNSDWKDGKVCVQLPIYNEFDEVNGLLETCCALEWPKLTIQLLDDSTDEASFQCSLAALKTIYGNEGERKEGPDSNVKDYIVFEGKGGHPPCEVIRRKSRAGFKAGALRLGYDLSDADYFCVFDADFRPTSNYLMQAMPLFDPSKHVLSGEFAEMWKDTAGKSRIGVVQTRWDFINAKENLLTRMQECILVGHHCTEQHSRYTSGLMLTFNGTAGLWDRQCIADAGGWSGETLCEDLLLSYRAQIHGWRVVYDRSISVKSILPVTLAAFKKQQQRWARGTQQSTFILLPEMWRATHLTFQQKLYATWHISGYVYMLLYTMLLMFDGYIHYYDQPSLIPSLAITRVLLSCPLGLYFLAYLYLGRLKDTIVVVLLMLIGQGISLAVTLAYLQATVLDIWSMNGEQAPCEFQRTPKGNREMLDGPEKAPGFDWNKVYLLRHEIAMFLLHFTILLCGSNAWSDVLSMSFTIYYFWKLP